MATKAIIGIYESIQDAANWATRTATDSTSGGSGSASFPASNIFTKPLGQYYQRTGLNCATNESVILDVQLVANSVVPAAGFSALIGLLNVRGFFDSGSNIGAPVSLNVRIRGSNSSFTGSYLSGYDYTRSVYKDSGLPKNAWFLPSYSSGVIGSDLSLVGTQRYGGSTYVRYLRIEINLLAATTNTYTIQVGRLCSWMGTFAPATLNFGYLGVDESLVDRAYDGTPYALRRSPRRKVSGKLHSLTDAMVFGESIEIGGSSFWVPSITAANSLSGSALEMAIVPNMNQSQAAVTGVKYPTIWQTMPAFGLMTSPFNSKLENKTGATDNFWTSDFELEEIVP